MADADEKLTREQVIAKLADWQVRLKKLFAEVETWANQLAQTTGESPRMLRGASLQLVEDWMEKFDLQPDLVPNLAILYGRNRVYFEPAGLWIIAANGRVNVTTPDRRYILVDLGGENDQPSNWVIVDPRSRNIRQPFNEAILRSLILEQALKAA